MVQNPTWPRIADVIDFYDSRGTPIAGCLCWVDLTVRGRSQTDADMGRQYETDQQRSGELRTVIDNYDSALDPTNPSSPFYPNVLVRRPMQRLAQYPASVNILSPDQATAGSWSAAPSGTLIQATNDTQNPGPGSSLSDQSGFLYVATTAGNSVDLVTVTDGPNAQCPNVYQVTAASGSISKRLSMFVPVIPGQQYTLQKLARCITPGASLQVTPQISFLSSGGPASTVSTASGGAVELDGFPGLLTQNPNFLSNTTGWAPTGGTLTRSTAVIRTGQLASGLLTPNGSATRVYSESSQGTVVAGTSYSASGWLYSPVGVTATISINWYGSGGYISTTSGTTVSLVANTWTQVTTTGTAPAAATTGTALPVESAGSALPTAALLYFVQCGLSNPAVTSYPWSLVSVTGTAPTTGVFGMRLDLYTSGTALPEAMTIQSTAWQLNTGPSIPAWSLPSPIYSLITAYNEGLPQAYDNSGQWGTSAITASDLLALLNQGNLSDSIGSTIMQYGPSFYYRLDDAQGATAVSDTAGFRNLAPIVNAPTSGSVTLGAALTATTPALIPVGSTATVAAFTGSATAVSGIDLTCGGIYPPGPAGGTSSTWSRAVAFRSSTVPATYGVVWGAYGPTGGSSLEFLIQIDPTGFLAVSATIAPSQGMAYNGTTSVCDGNWHTVLVAVNSFGSSTIYVDDVSVATVVLSSGGGPGTFVSDMVGGSKFTGGGTSYADGFTGQIAHIAEWPLCITPTNGWGLHRGLVPAYAGDSASVRWTRLLQFAAPYATYRVDPSVTTSVGAITDTNGDTAADAMTNQEVTENGDGFMSGWGIATFRSRLDRYNTTPIVTFGEMTANGETPYEAPSKLFDFDDTRTCSQIQVTQQPSGVIFNATDPRFPLPYGPSQMQRNSYATSIAEQQASAQYLLQRYMDPHLRVRQVRVHVSALAAWGQCLPLMLGSRVRVMRRPIGANPIAWDGFIEKMSWSFTSSADAWLTLQMSPADVLTYWVLTGSSGLGTASLTAAVGIGAATIGATSMPGGTMGNGGYHVGQTLVIDPGLATQEQVTVMGGPSIVTSVSGGQVTFGATVPISPTVFAHSLGATVAISGAIAGAAGALSAYSILGSTTRLAY
jgi:hypothetical protein